MLCSGLGAASAAAVPSGLAGCSGRACLALGISWLAFSISWLTRSKDSDALFLSTAASALSFSEFSSLASFTATSTCGDQTA